MYNLDKQKTAQIRQTLAASRRDIPEDKKNMYRLKFIITLLLISTKFMGQIIVSETNEHFEEFVNDIVRQNISRRIDFMFFSADSGKIKKTEIIQIDWEKENIIIVSRAESSYDFTLDQIMTSKYKYVEGYLSELHQKENGGFIEVTKIDDKNLILKGYRNGKIAVENKIMLNDNKETIFMDHTNYYAGTSTKPIRTITSYSKKFIDKITTVKTQESYDITDGTKRLNHKFETTEISTFDKKTNTKTLTCKSKTTLSMGSQPDSSYKIFLTYDSSGKITKVAYEDKSSMTISYK